MGGLSIWHWLVVGIVVLLLLGKGRFSDMMGDVAKGIKEFKKGMADDDASNAKSAQKIEGQAAPVQPTPTAAPVTEDKPAQ